MVNHLELQKAQVQSFMRKHEQAFARAKEERAKQQALLNNPELLRQHDEQEKQREAQAVERKAKEQSAKAERELERQSMLAQLEAKTAVRDVQKRSKQITQQSEQLQKRYAEQMSKVNELLVSIPGGKLIARVDKVTASDETTKPKPKLSDDDQYQTTIVTKMVALIKQRKMI